MLSGWAKPGDGYFYKIIPKYYTGLGEKGDPICINCSIDHLNEAMPFDRILVVMYLSALYECGMDLHFEFFILEEGSIKKKLAYAKQKVVWMVNEKDSKSSVKNLPTEVIKVLVGKG